MELTVETYLERSKADNKKNMAELKEKLKKMEKSEKITWHIQWHVLYWINRSETLIRREKIMSTETMIGGTQDGITKGGSGLGYDAGGFGGVSGVNAH